MCHASGWGANWLTGWTVKSKKFSKEILMLKDNEKLQDIFISEIKKKITERRRPNVEDLTVELNH